MKAKKVTEGEGYVSGDYECWCIHDVTFNEVQVRTRKWLDSRGEDGMPPESVYPSDFFPESIKNDTEGFDYSKKVRYKIIVEVEHIQSSEGEK